MQLVKKLAPLYSLLILSILGLTMIGDRFVTVMAQTESFDPEYVFVIDAGHGGVDGGATSCTGVLESQINLQIALRLEDMMHFLGHKTVMIRTTDRSVYTQGETIAAKKVSDLKQRVKIVNETENAVLLSIHQNNFSDSRYSGAQVFYTSDSESRELAQSVQTALIQVLNPGSKRKCKKADGIYLMQHINRPGILIECGFLSNVNEEAKLRDPGYQRQLCAVIAAAVSTHCGGGE